MAITLCVKWRSWESIFWSSIKQLPFLLLIPKPNIQHSLKLQMILGQETCVMKQLVRCSGPQTRIFSSLEVTRDCRKSISKKGKKIIFDTNFLSTQGVLRLSKSHLFFFPGWHKIDWLKILPVASWQLTNRKVGDISRRSRHSICQSFFSHMNL